jgi:prepilin-type N-terminal cleavage/methylation domain-containing protein
MRRPQGFTLIEIMIVVCIIAVLAAITVPSLLRARIQSNESAAISNLRVMVESQTAYHAANQRYAATFDNLTVPTPHYLDGDWSRARNGYFYTMTGNALNFAANANAEQYNVTGRRGFFSDCTGVIRYQEGANATAASTQLGDHTD